MLDGREGTLMPRDEAILTDIYFTGFLSTTQIAEMYFPHYEACRQRMYDLRKKKLVRNWPFSPKIHLWKLTKSAFDREIESLHREEERYRKWPKGNNIPHYVETNDIFVAVSGDLDKLLGRHPGWEWKDEARAFERYEFGAERDLKHQPDAAIHFQGQAYFTERQTRRAKETPSAFDKKMAGYEKYLSRLRGRYSNAQVLFACDEQRDMTYAKNAAEKHQVPTVVGSVKGIEKYLKDEARQQAEQAS